MHVTDATVIVEVLSPTTKNYDRGEKFYLLYDYYDFYAHRPVCSHAPGLSGTAQTPSLCMISVNAVL